MVLEEQRPARGLEPCRRLQVLHADRQPCQNPDLLSPHERLLDRRRALTRCIQIDGDDRVHESVGFFDPTAQLCSNAVGESERLPMSRRASIAERSQGSVMEHCFTGWPYYLT